MTDQHPGSLLSQYKLEYEYVNEEPIYRLIRNFKARMRYRKKKREEKRVHTGEQAIPRPDNLFTWRKHILIKMT